MRQRLAHELDELEQEVERPEQGVVAERRDEEFLRPAAEALGLDPEDDHQREHGERQREGGVDVGGGHAAPVVEAQPAVDRRHDVDGQEIHRVHQRDPDEHGQRDGRHPLALAVVDTLDLVVDEADARARRRPASWTARPTWPCA